MDPNTQHLPPPTSVSSNVTDVQSDATKSNSSSNQPINPTEVKSALSSTDATVSISRGSSIAPTSTAVSSAAFVKATTAAPSPPISISYPTGGQNSTGGATPSTGSTTTIGQKHVLPPPSTSSLSNGKSLFYFSFSLSIILTVSTPLKQGNPCINSLQFQI